MFSFYFISQVFMINTIILINLTPVLSDLPVVKLYQMVIKNEDYQSYLSRPMEKYEKKMDIEDFYKTVHNIDSIYIPEPFKTYDYEKYRNDKLDYCDSEFVTFEVFKRQNQVQVFANAIKEYHSCLVTMNTIHSEQNDADMEPVHAISLKLNHSPLFTVENKEKLTKILERMRLCLNNCFGNNNNTYYSKLNNFRYPKNLNSMYSGCFDYAYRESSKTKKHANLLMEKLNKELKHEYYEKFVDCTKNFNKTFVKFLPDKKESVQEKVTNIFVPKSRPIDYGGLIKEGLSLRKLKVNFQLTLGLQSIEKEIQNDFTMKELLLAQVLLRNSHSQLKNLDYSIMFHVILQLYELQITEVEKNFCKSKNKPMDAKNYTATKLSYMTLPILNSENTELNYREYLKKRDLIINHLMNIDPSNSDVYQKLLKLNDNTYLNDFENIIKIRSLNQENDYISYAKRIKHLSDYLPLPKHLWDKERMIPEEKIKQAEMERDVDLQ